MAKVLKKKADKPVVEEKAVAKPVKEEKPTPAKKTKAEKPAPVEKPVEEKAFEYPASIVTKDGKWEYIRKDDISFQDLKIGVENGSQFPYRILLRENGKLTQMIISFVGQWLNCIDITSTSPENKESIWRVNEAEFLDRECGGFEFAVYERIAIEVKPITEIEEPKAVAPKPRAKKPVKK